MNVLVVDNGSRHIDKIVDLFPDSIVTRKWFTDPSIHETRDDTIVILSGGNKLGIVKNPDIFKNEIDFIRNFGGPIVGICLGFELIAHAYGTQLYLMDERRSGIHTISTLEDGRELFAHDTADVYEAHRWHVRRLGSPLISLASSKDGVEMLRHESKNIYGTQFHPEVSDGNDGGQIFQRILDNLGVMK